jgi:sugar phosphate isomerase/epimerase
MLIERLRLAASDAEERGFVLVLENIGPSSGHSDEAVSIIEEVQSDYLKINFDTANPLLADEDPLEAFERMLPHISYIHLKDFITEKSENYKDYSQAEWRIQISRKGLKMTGITPGKGDIPLKKIFAILKDKGYKGFVSVEYENDIEPAKATLESIAFIASNS